MASTLAVITLLSLTNAALLNFETDYGGKPDDDSWDTVWANGAALNTSLNSLRPGDTFVVPNKKYYLMGGIKTKNLRDIVIQIDGTLEFSSTFLDTEKYVKQWPRTGPTSKGDVLECLSFTNLTNVTFTSASEGTLDGAGGKWWGVPGAGYLIREENRPRLLHISNSRNVLVQHLFFKDSPYWTFYASDVEHIEVRNSRIDARRTKEDSHSDIDLTAFNTDGFDFSGCNDVYVHDCSVWNQDDCFDVKDGTSNVLIENINASGLGLTIGSIASTVRNITFRNAYMHHTYKGIYMKFRGGGSVSDVLYENIVMDAPSQFAIWIGPAQQCDGCTATELCDARPCSLCWPFDKSAKCFAPADAQYTNITLRNITINNPKQSAGVLLANETSPMKNVVFENVVVNNPSSKPFGSDGYHCKNVHGVWKGTTKPVPPCFIKGD